MVNSDASNNDIPHHPIVFPSDDVVPDAPMVYDRHVRLNAPVNTVWPWLVQLGKHRGGWYLPSLYERWLLPPSWRATRNVQPHWQILHIGDRIPDYGTSNSDFLEVVMLDAPHNLVYRTERYGTNFSWALILREEGSEGTRLHLRFRGGIKSTGWRRKMIIIGGEVLDWLSTAPMVAGLAERVA